MQISEVRVKLVENRTDRLKAFCSVTFDDAFVVRDLKIIEGTDGYFVAMPSRKLTDHCHACGSKNPLRSKYCSECGARLEEASHRRRSTTGRTKLHADVAHPINQEAREYIQGEIVEAYQKEVELSKQPGYRPPKMDIEDEDYGQEPESHAAAPIGPESAPSEPASSEPASSEPAPSEPAPSEPSFPAEEQTPPAEEEPTDRDPYGFGEGIL